MAKIETAAETSEVNNHDALVEAFRADLLCLDLVDVIRKYVTTCMPVSLDASIYFQLRRKIAAHFQLHPNDVIIVGSSCLGFSLKPEKRFLRSQAKDIDVAIISEDLFSMFWDMVFAKVRSDRTWATANKQNKKFVRGLFAGWITPSELPSLPTFAAAREWVEFFDELTRSRLCGIRSVNARVYRDWDRLEAYQEIHFALCKQDLRRGSNERK